MISFVLFLLGFSSVFDQFQKSVGAVLIAVTRVVEFCIFLLKLSILVDWSKKEGEAGRGKKGEGVAKHGRSLGGKPHCEVVADFSVFLELSLLGGLQPVL